MTPGVPASDASEQLFQYTTKSVVPTESKEAVWISSAYPTQITIKFKDIQKTVELEEHMNTDCLNLAIRKMAREESSDGNSSSRGCKHYVSADFARYAISKEDDDINLKTCIANEFAHLDSKAEVICIPVTHEGHWTLYAFHMNDKMLSILDPLSNPVSHKDIRLKVLKALELANDIYNHLKIRFGDFSSWKHEVVNVPQNENSYDSGFAVFNFIRQWDGHQLDPSVIPTDSRILRKEFLAYILSFKDNKALQLPSDVSELIKKLPSVNQTKRYMAANSPPQPPTAGSSGGQAQPQMDKELLKAALCGDSRSMQTMASQDPGILLGTTLEGNTCLHISSSHGHQVFCTDVVVLQGSLLKAVNVDEETPLIAAVTNGYVPLASSLLKRCSQLGFSGAILQQDRYGFNALHHAIRNGHDTLALEFIEAELSLSQAVSKCNESAMFFAAMRSFTDVCEKLMQDPNCAYLGGKHGYNSLHAAVNSGNKEIAKMIMKKRPELAREFDASLATPVRHAVIFGKIEMLRVMLDHDSTLGYEITSSGNTLLTFAAFRGQVSAARELLKYCPDAPLYEKSDGHTLLHKAVCYDQPEFVEFVLRTPILRKLVNVQDKDGKTALHYAVLKCNPRILVALLSHKNIDATLLDNRGISAAWELSGAMKNVKSLNWNEAIMLMSRACPQDAQMFRNLFAQVKQETTEASRRDARSLTQRYTSNTSLVAILIATITFAAAFTLPGGYSSDDGSKGLPILSKKFAFKVFLISDVLAMCSSFSVAFICIIARWEDYEFLLYYRSFTKKLMWFAYVATTMAFSTGLYTVLASRLHWLAIAICVVVALFPIITWLLGKWPILKLRFRLHKSFRSDFLNMV